MYDIPSPPTNYAFEQHTSAWWTPTPSDSVVCIDFQFSFVVHNGEQFQRIVDDVQFLGIDTSKRKRQLLLASSQALLVDSSAGPPSARAAPRRPTLEILQPKTLIDEDAPNAMERAVDSAPTVWEMMKETTTSTSAMI